MLKANVLQVNDTVGLAPLAVLRGDANRHQRQALRPAADRGVLTEAWVEGLNFQPASTDALARLRLI